MIQTNKELSKELILELVKNYKANEVPRFKKLANYYDGKTAITERQMDEGKPNNKTVLNYPGYIVDMIQGYFIGIAVAYSSQDETKELLEEIQAIYNYNDENDENSELASIMGTKGIAYELLYADENADVRFNELEPDGTFIVYDTKIIPEPRFGIRFYEIDEIEYIEVYTDAEVIKYECEEDAMTEIERIPHFFGEVPIIPYFNNKKAIGDFEKVITLIDAIEIATSNSINDLEYFSDAYMYLIGMSATEDEDIAKISQQRILLLDENGAAGFLVKPSNNQDSENIKNRLNNEIHKFAKTPDMSDENFSSNASGIAMSYKHFGLDQVVSNKERKFKTGLYKRLELICNFLNTKVGTEKYNYLDIKMRFARNKPINTKEMVEVAQILKGIVSENTVLGYLPMVDDVNDELERIESERSAYSLGVVEDDVDV